MVAGAIAFLVALIFVIDAHPAIVTVFAVVISPAIWDLIRDNTATLEVDDARLAWTSGRRAAQIPFVEIDEVVLSTTLDFSQRAKVQLHDGRSTRIPPECIPNGRALDKALADREIHHRRTFFGL